jgi:hypothetical protein
MQYRRITDCQHILAAGIAALGHGSAQRKTL